MKAKVDCATDYLVGIDGQVEALMDLLDYGFGGARCLGIHGPGGIGKTTLAKALFDKLISDFEWCCFLRDVRVSSRRDGLVFLQKKLLSDILRGTKPTVDSNFIVDTTPTQINNIDDGMKVIRKELQSKKVLIVLDDVDHREQLEKLIGKISWFGTGSRVIITTRTKSVLEVESEEKTILYELKDMNFDHALQLYINHAFKGEFPGDNYYDMLSRSIVSTIGGLPLIIKVIGSFLQGKHETVWEDTLEKLRSIAHEQVHRRLKISYDALDFKQKQNFLDIACFSFHEEINSSYMRKYHNFFPEIDIEVLSSLSLINIGENGGIWMHNLLKDLGRHISYEENLHPEKRSRLWISEEAVDMVKTKESKGNIEALSLAGDPTLLIFTDEDFARLPNLRLLELDGGNFTGDFTNHFSELRWFSWRHCPPDLIATNLFPQNLVVLQLFEFEDANDWEGWSQIKKLHKLKVLQLTRVDMFIIDLSGCFTLERLIINDCQQLIQIDGSIGKLKRLAYLHIKGCHRLQDPCGEIGLLVNLKDLSLSNCSQLTKLPDSIGKLKSLIKLDLSFTSIKGLPCSIGNLVNLKSLSLAGCTRICELPDLTGNLKSLIELDLSSTRTNVSPYSFGLLKTSKEINMEHYQHEEFPSTSWSALKLEVIRARGCSSVVGEISSEIGKMSFLRILDLSYTCIRRVPETIGALPHLEELILENCNNLQVLPPLPASLTRLLVSSWSLQSIPDLSNLTNLVDLLISDVKHLSWLSSSSTKSFKVEWIGKLSKLVNLEVYLENVTMSLTALGSLSRLRKLHMKPPKSAMRANFSLVTTFPGLSNLRNLIILKLCLSREMEIQLGGLEQLRHLTVRHFPVLERVISSTSGLKNLKEMEIRDCPMLREIYGLRKLGTYKPVLQSKKGLSRDIDKSGNPSEYVKNESDTTIPDECLVVIQRCRELGNTPQDGMLYKDYRDMILGLVEPDSDMAICDSEDEVATMIEARQVASVENDFGTYNQVNHILSLMNINDKDKQIVVVILGEHGIGKTTLAKQLYDQVSCDFDGSSFLADIKETTQVLAGLQPLQTKLISDILRRGFEDIAFVNRGIEFFRDIFCNMRVLIVLDDVENAFHVQKLIRDCFNCFASGSRIVVTTRNSLLLEESPQIQTYRVRRLNNYQALQLFNQHAPLPTTNRNFNLLEDALNLMAGCPLLVEVMAATLNGKTEEEWNQFLYRNWSERNHRDFQRILEKGCQTLNYEQQQIFLDIFTTGIDSRIAWYLWYDTFFLPSREILTPLAKIGENNQIWMHSMLRRLGREMVRRENLRDPRRRSRLFNPEIALDTIKRKKGTEKVETLCLNFQWHTSVKLTPGDFESMPNIRFLQMDHAEIDGDFTNVFPKLRWLRWRGCPRSLQATNFPFGNLTILDLSWSKVTKDWQGWDQIEIKNLKVLDLTGCADLLVTPKFSGCQNLAILILERCSQLVKIDHSIGDLKCLVSMNIKFCTELSMLPVEVGHLTALQELLMDGTSVQDIPISIGHLKQLESLSASNCCSLSQLPRAICHLTNITLLSLDGTRITALPDSIGELVRLTHLSLRDCRQIRKLPRSIGNLGISLVELDVSGTGVFKFPDSFKNLQNLKVLRMDSCFFREFSPDIGELTSLEEIHASWCRSLEGGIPSEIGKLHNLRIFRLRHSTISSIPAEIHQLSNLQTLDLLHCIMIKELPRLPSSIIVLHVDDELKSQVSAITRKDICQCDEDQAPETSEK